MARAFTNNIYIPERFRECLERVIVNARGMAIKAPSSFQKKHYPVKIQEHLCDGEVVDGQCAKCERVIKAKRIHKPNNSFSLGYTLYYSDGSKQIFKPKE